MIKNLTLILTVILLITSRAAFSVELNTGERIKLNSVHLKEERELQILLPENYYSNIGATYPVIYLLDGDYTFHGVSGMLDFLANKGQLIPDVILVAVADKGTDKYRQYMTPVGLTAPLKKSDEGKAEQFLTFLSKEVKPYISNNYRAANNSTLVGHSIGGLFVLNALLESPESFENYVSISPSVWLNDHAILEKAKNVIGKSKHQEASLYLSLGDETRQGVYSFLHLLDKAQPKNIHWQFSHYPKENHHSVYLVSIRDSLTSIFDSWSISDKDLSSSFSSAQLVSYYRERLSTLNINQPIPTPSIQSAIRSFYRNKKANEIPEFMAKVKEELPVSEQAFIIMQASYAGHFNSPESAMKILKDAEIRFENSIEFMKSIAATYVQLDNSKMAIEYYKKSLQLAEKYNSNQWQINIIEAKLLKLDN